MYLCVARCTLPVACCTVYVARCLLHVVRGTLYVARCTVHVARCTLHGVRCLLHQMCCTLYAARSHGVTLTGAAALQAEHEQTRAELLRQERRDARVLLRARCACARCRRLLRGHRRAPVRARARVRVGVRRWSESLPVCLSLCLRARVCARACSIAQACLRVLAHALSDCLLWNGRKVPRQIGADRMPPCVFVFFCLCVLADG